MYVGRVDTSLISEIQYYQPGGGPCGYDIMGWFNIALGC